MNRKWMVLVAMLLSMSAATGCIIEGESDPDDVIALEDGDEQLAVDAIEDHAVAPAEDDGRVRLAGGLSVQDGLLGSDQLPIGFGEIGVDVSNRSQLNSEHPDGGEDRGEDEGPDPQPWHLNGGPDPQPWEDAKDSHASGPDPQPW